LDYLLVVHAAVGFSVVVGKGVKGEREKGKGRQWEAEGRSGRKEREIKRENAATKVQTN